MRKLSKRHIQANSYVDGNAWVRAWLTEDDIEGDPQIQKILQTDSDVDPKHVAGALAKRITEMLSETNYDEFSIKNVSVDAPTIDYKQIYDLIDKHKERNWERKLDQEYQALKKQLQTETDPTKRKQIEDRITELDDMEYEGSKVSPLKKRAYPEDKWPSQENAVG
ncbi:MAG: hypothetical protein ACREBJ_13375, partial [Nitrosotalea sp.]